MAALAMAALAMEAAPAIAQPAGDAEAGRLIATTWCANCHAVAPGASPPTGDAAPPFAAVAARPSTTALSLRVFLQTPHVNMPDYRLTPQQTDDVTAWILSLRR
jgi:mono/diheme cytochrome c family protein